MPRPATRCNRPICDALRYRTTPQARPSFQRPLAKCPDIGNEVGAVGPVGDSTEGRLRVGNEGLRLSKKSIKRRCCFGKAVARVGEDLLASMPENAPARCAQSPGIGSASASVPTFPTLASPPALCTISFPNRTIPTGPPFMLQSPRKDRGTTDGPYRSRQTMIKAAGARAAALETDVIEAASVRTAGAAPPGRAWWHHETSSAASVLPTASRSGVCGSWPRKATSLALSRRIGVSHR